MREGSAPVRPSLPRIHVGQPVAEGGRGGQHAPQQRARLLLVAGRGEARDSERGLVHPHGATPVTEGVVPGLLHAQSAQAPARVHGRAAEQSGELFGLHLVEQARRLVALAQQACVEKVDGGGAQMRHQASVRGLGGGRPAAAQIVDPEVRTERRPQRPGPVPQLGTARSAAGVEQIGAEQCRAMGVGLGLAADGAAGVRVGQIPAVAHGGPQPGQTPLGSREEFLGLGLG